MTSARQVLLGDVLRFGNGKSIKPGGKGRYPVYGSNGIIGGCDEFRHEDGVIIGRVGAYCGAVLYCQGKFWASDNTLVAYPANEKIDTKFLFYLLVEAKLSRYAGGAAQPLVTQTVLKQVEVRVPPLHTQRRIAGILSAYDELIENSQRRIKILESMASTIYREWFVYFRFPGSEKQPRFASALGEIPHGWEVRKLGDLVEFKKGKKPASVFELEEVGLQRHLLIDALRGGSSREFVAPEKLISTTPDDTIMVMDGSGSSDVFIGHEGVIGSTLGRYRIQVGVDIGPFWLFLFFSSHLAEIKSKNVGSAIPHANKDFINGMDVVIGPEDVMQAFEKAVEPMFGLIRSLNNRANTLRATRDLLLPRLLSGQINLEAPN